VQSLSAHLTQETKDRTLGGAPAMSSGNLVFAHGSRSADRLRIDYDRPQGQVICVAGDEIILYQPSINQETITKRKALAARNQEFEFIATPYDAASIKQRYDAAYIGDEQIDGQPTSKLELKPKNSASSVKSLVIWVSQSMWLPVKYQVHQPDTISTFTLTNVSVNPKLAADAFKVKVKAGTQVVRP